MTVPCPSSHIESYCIPHFFGESLEDAKAGEDVVWSINNQVLDLDFKEQFKVVLQAKLDSILNTFRLSPVRP